MATKALFDFLERSDSAFDWQFHIECIGLDKAPTEDWYCDEYCRENAAGRPAH